MECWIILPVILMLWGFVFHVNGHNIDAKDSESVFIAVFCTWKMPSGHGNVLCTSSTKISTKIQRNGNINLGKDSTCIWMSFPIQKLPERDDTKCSWHVVSNGKRITEPVPHMFPGYSKNNYDVYADVLILGAGMAGATAANTLAKHGFHDFHIIEGTGRVGGRIKNVDFGGYAVEYGASWITGTVGLNGKQDNPMFSLATKYDVGHFYNDYDDWRVMDSIGNDVTDEADASYENLAEADTLMKDYRRNTLLKDFNIPDVSVATGLKNNGWLARTAIDNFNEVFEYEFITAFPTEYSSLRYFYGHNEYFPYEDEELNVFSEKGAFVNIVNGLLDDISGWKQKISFNSKVERITYTNDGVIVETNNRVYKGKYAVITFSLGVLKSDAVTFLPPLPDWKLQAIEQFNMAAYNHIYMKFPSGGEWFVTNNTEWNGFASEKKNYFPIWQNFNKFIPGCRILNAAITHDEARRLTYLSDAKIIEEAMIVLRTMFGDNVPDPEDFLMSRWLIDPFTLGSYADWPVGFNEQSFEHLKSNVGPLYFAGDAYDDDFGYTNGAHKSSLREMTKLMEHFD